MRLLRSLRASWIAKRFMNAKDDGWRETRDHIKKMGIGAAPVANIIARKLAAASDDSAISSAVHALEAIAPEVKGDPKEVVPLLVAALDHKWTHVQRNAAEALKSYGSVAKEAVPALLNKLSHGEVAKAAAEALLSVVGLEGLPNEARFRAYIALGDSWRIKGLEKAQKMGKRYLPELEVLLLSIEPTGDGDYQCREVFLNAIMVYEHLGGVPTGRLQHKLLKLTGWSYDRSAGAKDVDDAIKVAKRVLEKAPALTQAELAIQIRGSSGGAQLKAIRACCNATDKQDEIVDALIPVASTWGANQIEAINCVSTLGKAAQKALSSLESVAREAGRPLRPEDFREQQEALGGLRDAVWDRINRREPLSPDVLSAAKAAIERIKQG